MSEIKTWQDRCEEHPDHQSGMVTHGMIKARMQEEIDDLRNQCEMWSDACAMVEMNRDQLRAEVERLTEAADGAMRQDRDQLLAERDALRADAERGKFLCDEWHSTIEGLRVPEWIARNALRIGGVRKTIDAALAARGKDE